MPSQNPGTNAEGPRGPHAACQAFAARHLQFKHSPCCTPVPACNTAGSQQTPPDASRAQPHGCDRRHKPCTSSSHTCVITHVCHLTHATSRTCVISHTWGHQHRTSQAMSLATCRAYGSHVSCPVSNHCQTCHHHSTKPLGCHQWHPAVVTCLTWSMC